MRNVEVDHMWTILQLKERIQDIERIPIGQHRLTFGGHLLKERRTLLDYDIKNKDIIRLFVE
jgi:hypothetical protein